MLQTRELRDRRADELRADLGAERRDLVAVLVRVAGEETDLEMGDADRAEASVRELGDAIGRAVHHTLRQVPRRLTDVRDQVIADLRHRARAHAVPLAQDRRDVVGELIERRRLRDPPVGHRRDAAERRPPGAADPDRRMWLLHRRGRCPTSRVDSGPVHSSVRAAAMVDSARSVVSPRPLKDAERVELAFDVSGADADDRPPVRQEVERRERLGGGERRLVGGDEDVRHQPRARGVRREIGKRRDRIEPLRRHHLRGLARDGDVVADGDVQEPGVVARLRDADHVVDRSLSLPRHRHAHRQRLHRELHAVREDAVGNDRDRFHHPGPITRARRPTGDRCTRGGRTRRRRGRHH